MHTMCAYKLSIVSNCIVLYIIQLVQACYLFSQSLLSLTAIFLINLIYQLPCNMSQHCQL